MDSKSAVTIAMLFGAMVCGGVFVTLAKDGNVLMGMVGGGLVGIVSGLMFLGLMSGLVKKENRASPRDSTAPAPNLSHHDRSNDVSSQNRSSNEKAVVHLLSQTFVALGLSFDEATQNAAALFNEVKGDLLTRSPGIDIFNASQGTTFSRDESYMAPRLKAGLSRSDVESFWNRPIVLVMCEMKMREMMAFIAIDAARQQDRDMDAAAREYVRNSPRYGNPDGWSPSNDSGLRECDADIYLEFATRVEAWRAKTPDNTVSELIAQHGTFNAAVRHLVSESRL